MLDDSEDVETGKWGNVAIAGVAIFIATIIAYGAASQLGIFNTKNTEKTAISEPVKPEVSFTTVFMGDSLTYGTGASKNLTMRLQAEYPKGKFINLGVPGDSTTGMLSRIGTVDQYKPKRVVIWGGVNDTGSNVSAEKIEANLQAIYDYCNAKGYEVWAFTITPRNTDTDAIVGVRDEVDRWILSEAKGVTKVVDTFKIVADPYDTRFISRKYASDTVHFNDVFYKELTELLVKDFNK